MTFDPSDPLGRPFADAVSATVAAFLAARQPTLDAIGPELAPLAELAAHFAGGGKRFRPSFCYWGYVAATGQPADAAPVLAAAGSLDLLHVAALMHDDVMDASDTRRGGPSAHKVLEALHGERDWRGSAEQFGRAGAILLGDLLTMWSAQLFDEASFPPAAQAAALPLLHAVRTEVTSGQFLDIVAQSRPLVSSPGAARAALDEANRVVEYKSARYTVVRPVQIGAALGGASSAVLAGLQAFGSPLGRAFQFRDDVLGVFGDEALTGKPAGDDLREGKRTMLVAHALEGTTPAGAARLDDLLGAPGLDDAGVAEARAIIVESGALDALERTIADGIAESLAALADLDVHPDGRTALVALAGLAVSRTS